MPEKKSMRGHHPNRGHLFGLFVHHHDLDQHIPVAKAICGWYQGRSLIADTPVNVWFPQNIDLKVHRNIQVYSPNIVCPLRAKAPISAMKPLLPENVSKNSTCRRKKQEQKPEVRFSGMPLSRPIQNLSQAGSKQVGFSN